MPLFGALALPIQISFEMELADILVALRCMLEQRDERKSFNVPLAESLLEVGTSAAGGWGGGVNACGKSMLVVYLPGGGWQL